jgi:hypothetical protein
MREAPEIQRVVELADAVLIEPLLAARIDREVVGDSGSRIAAVWRRVRRAGRVGCRDRRRERFEQLEDARTSGERVRLDLHRQAGVPARSEREKPTGEPVGRLRAPADRDDAVVFDVSDRSRDRPRREVDFAARIPEVGGALLRDEAHDPTRIGLRKPAQFGLELAPPGRDTAQRAAAHDVLAHREVGVIDLENLDGGVVPASPVDVVIGDQGRGEEAVDLEVVHRQIRAACDVRAAEAVVREVGDAADDEVLACTTCTR